MPQTSNYENFDGGVKAQAGERCGLERQAYISADVMRQEWDAVWTRSWLFAGLESDIPEPGDYFVYELAHESIVVLRNAEQGIAAFYNVCQHRGNRIFTNAMGMSEGISCPYHGWTYDWDGKLTHVPDRERFSQGVPPEQRSLKPVKVATWEGLVWINMDPHAGALDDFLGVILTKLAPYRFERMVLAKHQTVALNANWKTVKDNFLEQYHVDFIHPQHASFVDCCNAVNTLWPYGHSATRVEGFRTNSRYPLPEEVPEFLLPLVAGIGLDPADFHGRMPELRQAAQQQKRLLGAELGFDYSGLTDDQVTDVWQYDIFPNLFMTVQPEEVWIYGPRPHPTDPDKCCFDKWTLQVAREAGSDPERGLALHPGLQTSLYDYRPDHEVFTQQEVIEGKFSMTITIDQDIYYLPDMQAGLHSRGFDHAWLNDDEARLQHFHDWLQVWMHGNPLLGEQA